MTHHPAPSFSISSIHGAQRTLKTTRLLVLGLVLLLFLAGGWRYADSVRQAENLRQSTVDSLQRSVITTRSKAGTNARKLSLPATLRGYSETQIYARANGYLKAWHKTIGDQVKKGELLAEIDVPELDQELTQARAAVAQVKARLDLSRSTLQRWSQLNATDGAPQQEFDEKRAAFLQAEADLAAAGANVKRLENIEAYRRIVAPFAGVITRRGAEVGGLVTAGSQELFALTQIDPLRLSVWVPQSYAEDIKVGQSVAVSLLGRQGKSLEARIEHVAGALDPVTRARQVEIKLPNPDGKLLPGAYVEIALNLTGKASPLLVPVNVLVIDKEGSHVVVVGTDNKLSFHPVKLGRDFGREVEIVEGITSDDLLVASPSDLLVEGEVVSVVEAQAKPVAKASAPAKASAG